MTALKRMQNGLFAIGQIALVIVLLMFPGKGLRLITAAIQVFLLFCGVQYIVYYFTMAKYMVDGKAMLYKGGLYLNFCIFVGFMNVSPTAYVMMYLIGYFLLRSILRAFHLLGMLQIGDMKWISAAVSAAMYFGFAVYGILNVTDQTVMIYLFCIDLTLSAIQRIGRIMKKTAIVYIA